MIDEEMEKKNLENVVKSLVIDEDIRGEGCEMVAIKILSDLH